VWYSSYVTIDWLHDAIKESSRIRRVRHLARRSFRGAVVNAWDRFQGWLVVTLIGILTALVAFCIIRSEMSFFDLKEGFCGPSWGKAKRFCCAPTSHIPPPVPSSSTAVECDDWVEWGQFFGNDETDSESSFWNEPEFVAYFFIALALACTASALTYYITSSATHVTSKDSAFLGPTRRDMSTHASPVTPKPTERQPLLQNNNSNNNNHNNNYYNNNNHRQIEPEPEPPAEAARPVIYMAAGSGIPEIKTILSGFVIHGYLGVSTLFVKSIGLALSVGSGLSLGKEGPFVHIASCIANIVSRAFSKYEQNEGKRRELLSAACAAGVAVSFGAPIGGVLFSLEEASYYFPPKVMWRSFWCAAVAAITLKALNPYGNGSLVLFAVTYTKEYHYWEFGVFILLGIFGGLYGALFSRLNIVWSREVRKKTWLSRHPITEVALVTALTTIVSFMNPYTRMSGTELIAKLFADCKYDSTSPLCVDRTFAIWPIISAVGAALLIKATLTIITFGVVLPAGIFIPSLVIGACFGRIVGVIFEYCEYHYSFPIFDKCGTEECVVAGIYAMVGAAATLAGVTRTTVSLAVIMFELTGTLNYVPPVMLAVLVAKAVADGLEKRGIYELVIELKKLPYLSNKEEYLWGGRLVSEVVSKNCPELSDTRWTAKLPACVPTSGTRCAR
jgi:chloride channel 3/4/5